MKDVEHAHQRREEHRNPRREPGIRLLIEDEGWRPRTPFRVSTSRLVAKRSLLTAPVQRVAVDVRRALPQPFPLKAASSPTGGRVLTRLDARPRTMDGFRAHESAMQMRADRPGPWRRLAFLALTALVGLHA